MADIYHDDIVGTCLTCEVSKWVKTENGIDTEYYLVCDGTGKDVTSNKNIPVWCPKNREFNKI